jgi:hypothetical protein
MWVTDAIADGTRAIDVDVLQHVSKRWPESPMRVVAKD